MNFKQIYPKCITSFQKFLKSDQQYSKIYTELLKSPKVFDVSLRDGLQSINKYEINSYDISKKKEIYYNILETQKPEYMEIGSFVSPKMMPIFNDTIELYRDLEINAVSTENGLKPETYLFIPTFEKLVELNMTHNDVFSSCKNFSLITSCSFGFQMKNINKTLIETKNELKKMMEMLEKIKGPDDGYKIKLYISCVNECPINGKLDLDYIVDEIMYYYMNYKLSNICLSDTMGTLEPDDFEKIIDKCLFWGLNIDFISLHLHFKEGDEKDEERVEKIMKKALSRKINLYDVSELRTGGCELTLQKKNLKNNLTYELFYKCLVDKIVDYSFY